ncbi:MAG: class I SAM-dependent methyltransferase [Dehalococcoidia bacterium]
MSLAPSKSAPTAEPAFDLDYSIHDFEIDPHADSQFLFRRIEEAMLREGAIAGGRTLDVACGAGQLAARVRDHGGEGWGLDPSPEMLGISRWLVPADHVVLVRGLAEQLPFRDGSFDRVICQGSLDHFVDPSAFISEAARIVRPEGRVVIALANYRSLSCRLGQLAQDVGEAWFGRRSIDHRPYWVPPPDHFHLGDLRFVRRLGGRSLRLERCYGISLLWLLRSYWGDWRWGAWLDSLPRPFVQSFLTTLDTIGQRVPALADMIVSVWQPR